MISTQTSRGDRATHAKIEEEKPKENRKKTRYSDAEVQEMLRRLKEEYEVLAGAQKDRIVTLRENLQNVNRELEDAHKERVDIACALVNARKCADSMISDAKAQAARILSDAKRRRDELKEQVRMYELTLLSIKSAAKNVLSGIEQREPTTTLTLLHNTSPEENQNEQKHSVAIS